MAIITNNKNTIRVNDSIFQKTDVSIRVEGAAIEFTDGETLESIPYAEITSPSSASISDLINTLNGYLNDNANINAENSSTTALNDGETFTGEWVDASAYSSIVISYKTDQNGILTLQFSPDGTNIDSSLLRYYSTNQIEPPHRFTITRKYVRVLFQNNSGSNQTYLRLQTLLGNYQDLNTPCDSILSQDYDAQSTRPTDFKYETALGLRQGRTTWNKWGYNDDIDTGATEVIWSVGGSFTKLSSASTLSIVSTSTDDANGGIGANSIIVYGIDANRMAQTEVVTMNGTTPVVTTTTWLGINRMSIYVSGSGEANIGTITATAVTGGTTQGQIPIGSGSTQQAIFFTQAGHTALMDWLFININKIGGSAPIVTIKAFVFSFVSGSRYEVYRKVVDTSVENTIQLKPTQPFVVGEKSVIYFTAETTINNTIVSMRFSLIEFKNVSTN